MSRRVQDDRPLGELIKNATNDISLLLRKEIELAKLEVREEVREATNAGKAFGAAAVAGYLALVLLAFALAWSLAEVVPAGVAFLIAGGIFGGAAVGGFLFGRERIRRLNPMPEQTVATIREDVQWLKARKT